MKKIAHPVYFLRHGATDWNDQGRYQGTVDTSLSKGGREDAKHNAELLQELIGHTSSAQKNMSLVSSPLQRARQTSEIVSGNLAALPVVTCDRAFRELSMGRWEGLTSQQVKQQFYEERKSRKCDRWNFKPVGGESMADRRHEIQGALSGLAPHTIVVTHSVVLRIINCLLTDISEQASAIMPTPHVSIWCWNGAKLHRQGQN